MIFLFPILLNICISKAAVFLWSNKKLEISPLQPFSSEQFSNLTKELGDPEVYYFRSSSRISPYIKDITDGYYTAYVPNGDIEAEESIDLFGSDELDAEKIKETLSETNKSSNILSVIVIPYKRYKREIEKAPTELSEVKPSPQQKGPVIYKQKHKNGDIFALLYSSKPLLLKINDSESSEMYLGNTASDMIIYDNRLNVIVKPIGGNRTKISLRFSISWLNGYWSLPSVKVTDTDHGKDYNLTTDEDIMAPAHFSYHCNGHTVFSDGNGSELHIYDLQVQLDSKNEKFGDANDCVSFTTAPIWSGLFVTTLLGIGLIVALTAIMDIKTMDKFDNYKTKNLNITISE